LTTDLKVEAVEDANIDETVIGLVGAHLNPLQSSVRHNLVNDLSEELLCPRKCLMLLIEQPHVEGVGGASMPSNPTMRRATAVSGSSPFRLDNPASSALA